MNRVHSLNEMLPQARVTALIEPRQMCGTTPIHLDLKRRIDKDNMNPIGQKRRYELD